MCITRHYCDKNFAIEEREPKSEHLSKDCWLHPWPIPRSALAAFIDMGVSEVNIARYFKIEHQDVSILRLKYRL